MKRLRWWWRSVQGLRIHLAIHKAMRRALAQAPLADKSAALISLRRQETMIGHCLLHVLLVYPPGSGAFFDEED